MELCAEWVNPCRLRVPAFARQALEPVLLCMRGGIFFVRATACGAKHMNLISSKMAKHVDVLKLFASIAFRPVSSEQRLHYDVTTHSCETVHAFVTW